MSEPNGIGPRERRAAQEVGALPEPRAREEFRSELRRAFVVGELKERAGDDGESKVRPFPLRFLVPLAIAAAILGVVVLANRGPGWEVTDPAADGRLWVDDRVYAAGDVELGSALVPGARVRGEGDQPFDLTCPGTFALQVTPGSEMTLPAAPRRWIGRGTACEVTEGEVRLVTGPSFAGARLRIDAPSATIDVVGTTLAVICNPCTTCVCVLEGEVEMTEHGTNERQVVTDGRRRTVFDDGRTPIEEEIFPMERMKLDMLRESATPRLGRD